jgi:hypothetical protein
VFNIDIKISCECGSAVKAITCIEDLVVMPKTHVEQALEKILT